MQPQGPFSSRSCYYPRLRGVWVQGILTKTYMAVVGTLTSLPEAGWVSTLSWGVGMEETERLLRNNTKSRHYTGLFRISLYQTAKQTSRTTLLKQCACVNSCCLSRPSKIQDPYHLTHMTGVSTHLFCLLINWLQNPTLTQSWTKVACPISKRWENIFNLTQ